MSVFIMRRGLAPGVLPAPGKTLNDYTWEEISMIAGSGKAAEYFSVGDRKAVLVKGTVGTLQINATYYVYIIGFDHNGATNSVDFGTFKTALSGGTDICLVDSLYGAGSEDGTKSFYMNHWLGGSVKEDLGGWRGCDARYDILGSTDIPPDGYGSQQTTDRLGYDASPTCATKPVPNTLMAALPADLRAVMKPMTIFSTNASAYNGADESDISATVDYLPLPSCYEVTGEKANAEQNPHQSRYTYYANGNSAVKYRQDAQTTAVNWLTRSPFYGPGSSMWWGISAKGANTNVYNSAGIAPIFRV